MVGNFPEGYQPVSSRAIRELVELIVDSSSGDARVRLEQLRNRLLWDIAHAADEESKKRDTRDLFFLEGYLGTPASQFADIKSIRKGH
jgi:hypothetical protein